MGNENPVRIYTTHISSGDFSEQITYVKNGHGYNGTISATTLTQGNVTLQWDYQYDSHKRLSSAQWSEGEDTWEAEKFTYDPMGNILTLKRRIHMQATNSRQFQTLQENRVCTIKRSIWTTQMRKIR